MLRTFGEQLHYRSEQYMIDNKVLLGSNEIQ